MGYTYTVTFADGYRDFAKFSALMNDVAQRNGLQLVGLNAGVTPVEVPLKAVEVKEILPFAKGDAVLIEGDQVAGEGVVEACWNKVAPKDHPEWNRPYQTKPQVEIRLLRTGKLWHFNGDDIDAGKVRKIAK